MQHSHAVTDSDTRFIINPTTRQVRNDGSRKVSLIQYDHNSERFTFECPKYIEGHDMGKCNRVEIHYVNIDTQTKQQHTGVYVADDLTESGDVVTCSWLISNNATQLVGVLSFVVRYTCVVDDTVTYAWSSAVTTVNI